MDPGFFPSLAHCPMGPVSDHKVGGLVRGARAHLDAKTQVIPESGYLATKCLDSGCPAHPGRSWEDTCPNCVAGCYQGLAPVPAPNTTRKGKPALVGRSPESCICSLSLPRLVSLLSSVQHTDFPLGRLNLSNINTALTKSAQIDSFYCCLQPQAYHVSAEAEMRGRVCRSASQIQPRSLVHGSRGSSRLGEDMYVHTGTPAGFGDPRGR